MNRHPAHNIALLLLISLWMSACGSAQSVPAATTAPTLPAPTASTPAPAGTRSIEYRVDVR